MKHKGSLPPERLMHVPDCINWDHIKKNGSEMSQAVDDHGFYEEWETAKMMELQDQELRRARKGGNSEMISGIRGRGLETYETGGLTVLPELPFGEIIMGYCPNP